MTKEQEEDANFDLTLTCHCILEIAKDISCFELTDLSDTNKIQKFQLLLLEMNEEINNYYETIFTGFQEGLDGTED